MKKKNLLLVLLSSLGLIARGQDAEIKGHLKGLAGAPVEISYKKNGAFKSDTVIAHNDDFIWKGNLNEPQLIGIAINHYVSFFFAGPGHIKLAGDKDSSETYLITGSPMQDDVAAFGASIKDLTAQEEQLYARYGSGSAEDNAILKEKKEELYKQREIRVNQYIANHPKSFYSLYMLASGTSFSSEYTEVKPIYEKLDKSLKQTESGKKLAHMLTILKKSQIGKPMPDFVQSDSSGIPVKFSSFKGKYILVDFWASWCGPCRAENPNVLKAYNAYKDKGFTVVGVSLDDKAANWKKAIRDDKMPWTQLSDLKGWKNEVATDFGIESIPGNLLIDPSGKIVARNLRGVMLENKLNELFK